MAMSILISGLTEELDCIDFHACLHVACGQKSVTFNNGLTVVHIIFRRNAVST